MTVLGPSLKAVAINGTVGMAVDALLQLASVAACDDEFDWRHVGISAVVSGLTGGVAMGRRFRIAWKNDSEALILHGALNGGVAGILEGGIGGWCDDDIWGRGYLDWGKIGVEALMGGLFGAVLGAFSLPLMKGASNFCLDLSESISRRAARRAPLVVETKLARPDLARQAPPRPLPARAAPTPVVVTKAKAPGPKPPRKDPAAVVKGEETAGLEEKRAAARVSAELRHAAKRARRAERAATRGLSPVARPGGPAERIEPPKLREVPPRRSGDARDALAVATRPPVSTRLDELRRLPPALKKAPEGTRSPAGTVRMRPADEWPKVTRPTEPPPAAPARASASAEVRYRMFRITPQEPPDFIVWGYALADERNIQLVAQTASERELVVWIRHEGTNNYGILTKGLVGADSEEFRVVLRRHGRIVADDNGYYDLFQDLYVELAPERMTEVLRHFESVFRDFIELR